MSLQKRFPKALAWDKGPIYLMDGTAFVYRSYYAKENMQRSDGFPTSAIFGITRILLRLLRDESPDRIAFVLDGKGQHFRHELFPLYKAQRSSTPEPLIQQIEPIRKLIDLLGIHFEESENCEADDCIASMSQRFENKHPIVIVGTDKDLRQCLTQNVIMWDPVARDERVISLHSFIDETGLRPEQWPDLQAIVGDSSDNIPGVPGIGIKTATKIFAEFKSLEDIRDRQGDLAPKLAQKFEGHIEAMFLYRDLTRLSRECCPEVTLEHIQRKSLKAQALRNFLREFELNSLMRDLESLVKSDHYTETEDESNNAPSLSTTKGDTVQTSLLDAPKKKPKVSSLCKDIKDIPSCAKKDVAIINTYESRQNLILIAFDGVEYSVTDSTENIVNFVKEAKNLITPSYKALLHSHSAWRKLAPSQFFDISLAAYLMNPEDRDYAWPHLMAQWTDIFNVPQSCPGLLALAIKEHLSLGLEKGSLASLMTELELPLVPVLVHMEKSGICLDNKELQNFMAHVSKELEANTIAIYSLAGEEFNIRSAQQLGNILYSRLKLPIPQKTPGGQLSTKQEALEKLHAEHPIIEKLLQFRKLEKLRSTYLEPLPRYINQQGYKDDRLHTKFNQLATATGRLSSSQPNLQNIPIRGEMGQRMRTCFTAQEGSLLVAADYSQIELRVLAHYSQDPTLLAAFLEDADIHTRTAALLYNEAEEKVNTEQRRTAKTINFGLIYGMGANKLAQELGITTKEAKVFIERYFESLQRLKEFYLQVEEATKKQGYVTTIAGRRRLVQGFDAKNSQAQALARRQAVNTLIQGSAADIIKWAMLSVFHDKKLEKLEAKLILQVHDELLFEVPEANAHKAGERIAELMAGACPKDIVMSVPLKTSWGLGANWGDAH